MLGTLWHRLARRTPVRLAQSWEGAEKCHEFPGWPRSCSVLANGAQGAVLQLVEAAIPLDQGGALSELRRLVEKAQAGGEGECAAG